jgi:2-(3-amino-3-carboxypropyl)histidine synthase
MRNQRFNLEKSRLKREVRRHGARKVLLQLPEGLKPESPQLAAAVEEAGAQAVISGDPCYGACDLALNEAETLGADLIVHYGHSPMLNLPRTAMPAVYIPAEAVYHVTPTKTLHFGEQRIIKSMTLLFSFLLSGENSLYEK